MVSHISWSRMLSCFGFSGPVVVGFEKSRLCVCSDVSESMSFVLLWSGQILYIRFEKVRRRFLLLGGYSVYVCCCVAVRVVVVFCAAPLCFLDALVTALWPGGQYMFTFQLFQNMG